MTKRKIKRWPNIRGEWPPQSILARIPASILDQWLNAGEVREFRANEVLLHEGAKDSSVILILSGCVKVVTRIGDDEVLLAVRVGGDLVGEFAALDHGVRSATVVACGRPPVLTCSISDHDFNSALDGQQGEVAREITASIVAKLRSATRRRADLAKDSHARLASLVVDLADDYGHPLSGKAFLIKVNLTQGELGALIGVSEATAHRAIRRLKDRRLVEVSGRRLIAKDLDALRAIASTTK
ncbi:Crp/Fnr family transcriptional regulator [Amycolatopsis magusensis]|uniref:Crp/Fnr family transcriptional regulator n=1 Tax=Amycolatopsis magusensis TaxID=882444 RepID=UPI0024A8CC77|nr:Crp/Fnr family transcriptional regulator [Amycolatopsis magusensis]MDI5974997.1 Crp/Fnr family transcriptional regulator [Amycolatopsis magusensis]